MLHSEKPLSLEDRLSAMVASKITSGQEAFRRQTRFRVGQLVVRNSA